MSYQSSIRGGGIHLDGWFGGVLKDLCQNVAFHRLKIFQVKFFCRVCYDGTAYVCSIVFFRWHREILDFSPKINMQTNIENLSEIKLTDSSLLTNSLRQSQRQESHLSGIVPFVPLSEHKIPIHTTVLVRDFRTEQIGLYLRRIVFRNIVHLHHLLLGDPL